MFFGLRQHGADGLKLLGHGQFVAGAGDVAAVGEAGLLGGGHGGVDHGDLVLRGVVGAHGDGRGDGADEVVAIGDEVGGDGGGHAGVGLGVLVFDGEVLALDDAFFGKAGEEAFAAVVQRAVLGELGDADGVALFFGNGEAGQGKDQGDHQGGKLLHGGTSSKNVFDGDRRAGEQKNASSHLLETVARGATQLGLSTRSLHVPSHMPP